MASNGISIREACRLLGVAENELRAMMADGRLPYRRVNGMSGRRGRIVIRSTDIHALLRPSRAATLRSSRMRKLLKGIERDEFVRP
jgi:excisionase family DNA binding protein